MIPNASVLFDGNEFYVEVRNKNGTTRSATTVLRIEPDDSAPRIERGILSMNYLRSQPIVGQYFDGWSLSARGLSKPVKEYSATGLPSWATLDPYSGTITGTPTAASRGRIKIFLTPYEGTMGMVEMDFYVAPDTDGDGLNDDIEDGYGRYLMVKGFFTPEEALANLKSSFGEESENRINLASITSEAEWEVVKRMVTPTDLAAGFWLGGQRESADAPWKWASGEEFSFTRFIE